MASTYKAPGVYIEEITKFPPSVAAVETAIPAFIGYTEKAEKNGESLKNVPTSVTSFLEFEQHFGGPPPRNVILRLNSANQYVKTERQGTTYLLYDSLRLFYDNGGGECYIVSVDDYKVPPEIGNAGTTPKGILGGLKALEKYDKPTLIVSPDATSIGAGLYTFQQQALLQCNKLQDRFLICDLLKNNELVPNETLDDRVSDFRGSIGINYLKYGAAYVPWLKTSLPVDLTFRDVIFAFETQLAPNAGTSLSLLLTLTNSVAIQQLLYDLTNSIKAVDDLKAKLVPGGPLVAAGNKDLREQIKKMHSDFMSIFTGGALTFAAFSGTLLPLYQKNRDILLAVKAVSDSLPLVVPSLPVASPTQTVEFKLKQDIATLTSQAKIFFRILATHHKEMLSKSPGPLTLFAAGPPLDDTIRFLGYPNPPSIGDVEIDLPTRQLYRMVAARNAVLNFIATTATTAAGLAGATAGSVATAVGNLIPATNNLKAKADTEMNVIRVAANLGAAKTQLGTDIGTAPANEKIAFTMLQALVLEEELNGVTTLPLMIPVPPGVPAAIADAIFQEITALKIAVDAVAAPAPAGPTGPVVTAATIPVVTPREYSLIAANGAASAAEMAIAFFEAVQATAETYEDVFDQSLLQTFGTYKTLVTKAAQELMVLPPSGGVAGVYASVDSNRGVWKAPANASLNSVLAPHTIINVEDQEELNIDPNAGKSINAIRQFIGKGTLVWGTRTLAGNDNEWKFVPVRRFFTYAEESIKKATEPFVFEPNDRNTWVRVKAMIENFLTLEWRRGALAGAKPGDAFYVKVGLGETMTAVDILDGKMIIEVGMAVVRPAEFIILRFAHKMQES